MSRDHRSMYGVAALLERHGIQIDRTRGPQHRRPRAAETALAQPTETELFIAEMRMLGAHAYEVLRDTHGPCKVCQLEGREGDTEVYIGRDGHEVMCRPCARQAVKGADRPTVVEVLIP
ncbi:hypothetical protein [Amycolatopsis taiwanensis]|uniref:hypothetical protein n=1 Tax=Amycolatopsis taiwanensis TaxID=342230 RepID=UPI00048488D2|nr:hypothetical protein [Amycolatopsis taiwanensis]